MSDNGTAAYAELRSSLRTGPLGEVVEATPNRFTVLAVRALGELHAENLRLRGRIEALEEEAENTLAHGRNGNGNR